MARNLYYYEYVRRPAADIYEAIDRDRSLLIGPTKSAVARADAMVGQVRFTVDSFSVGRDVTVELGDFVVEPGAVHMPITWRAATRSSLFPHLTAEIELRALSDSPPETQVSLIGSYTPPLGVLGVVGDLVVGHLIAEAVVREFVVELARRLQAEPVPGPKPL